MCSIGICTNIGMLPWDFEAENVKGSCAKEVAHTHERIVKFATDVFKVR